MRSSSTRMCAQHHHGPARGYWTNHQARAAPPGATSLASRANLWNIHVALGVVKSGRSAAEHFKSKGKLHAHGGRRDYRDADTFGYRQSGIRRESRPNVLSRRRFVQGRLSRQDAQADQALRSFLEEQMTRSQILTALIAVGAVVFTSTVTPASAARRHVGWRNAAVAAGVAAGLAAAAAAASGAYSGYGYGFGGYGYGRYHGRCGGGAYC
jgi:hypothetical protein